MKEPQQMDSESGADPKEIVLPDGRPAHSESQVQTERGRERNREGREYIPVVIKRTDQAVRHPDDTLERAIEEGLEQLSRPTLSLVLSSLAAGITVGFSAMAVAVVTELTLPFEHPLLTRLATALVYPLGFMVCVMSGAQLFTEHTATAVYPWLDRRVAAGRVLRLWVIVIAGNLVGAVVISLLLSRVSGVLDADRGVAEVAHHLVNHSWGQLMISSILAGLLMAQGAWLVLGTLPDLSQMASIYTVTMLIGLGGFHHSIAGATEILTAVFVSEEFSSRDVLFFLPLALLGNLVGGSIFVGVLNYAHIRQTQPADE